MENNENYVYWKLEKYQLNLLLKQVNQFKTENEKDNTFRNAMREDLLLLLRSSENPVSWKLVKGQVDFLLKFSNQLENVEKENQEAASQLLDDLSFLFQYLDALENPDCKDEDEEENA